MRALRICFLITFLGHSLTWAAEEPSQKARSYIQKIKNSPQALIAFDNEVDSFRNAKIYLFIQGIELGQGEQWAAAFDVAIERKVRFYFHKIYNRKSLARNVDLIKKSISDVQRRHPKKQIEVMAYSAGGAATLVAWRDLPARYLDSDRIHLTTVASPLSGYGAPGIAIPIVSLFFGAYNGKMARGFAKELNGQHLTHCRHFVNTNCALDRHSCPRGGTRNSELLPEMPCGADNITEFHDETHESIVARAAEIIID
ncbi:MAG: hypothetical protein A2X86_16420 [Bdellovibrionales bacterium GWA2_49_15]|nr:MAG: hypothetical protein A2X86_16420 [Bdellovibrionales bacterium GWA2_49_15]HAZ13690.1 hypothetical protein [Bdellovibrionales bacterium]